MSIKDESRVYFSDKPESSYENSSNTSVVSQDFALVSPDLVVAISSRYDLEKNYDYGYFEVQVDDGSCK